jgi:hypothetical protein
MNPARTSRTCSASATCRVESPHLGWKLALNLKLSEGGFHPTTLVYFRQRLIEHAKADVAMRAVLAALQQEGLIPKRSKQRLDSTHILSAVRDLSALECVRETLRLALEELARNLAESERPDFWGLFWERYVESKLDYKSGVEVLKNKHRQAGEDCLRLLQWLEPMAPELRYGQQVELLREVFAQQYQQKAGEGSAGQRTRHQTIEAIKARPASARRAASVASTFRNVALSIRTVMERVP